MPYKHCEFLFHGHFWGLENLHLMQVNSLGFDEWRFSSSQFKDGIQ